MKKVCQTIQKNLVAYIYDKSSNKIKQHLDSCSVCYEKYQHLKKINMHILSILPCPDEKKEEQITNELKDFFCKKFNKQKSHNKFSNIKHRYGKFKVFGSIAAAFLIAFIIWNKNSEDISNSNSSQRIERKMTYFSLKGLNFIKYGSKNWTTNLEKTKKTQYINWFSHKGLYLMKKGDK